MQDATVARSTKETQIQVQLCLNGGEVRVRTGIGFFDHMLTNFAVHGGFGLQLDAKGDLHVDCHHTVEDCGIVLGQAFAKALGDRGGIARYGTFFLPMDEALAMVSVDVSGRPYLVFDAAFAQARVGEFDSCMTGEFFRAFAMHAGMTLHCRVLYGENTHHEIEALFKAFGHALRQALRPHEGLLSTKGVL